MGVNAEAASSSPVPSVSSRLRDGLQSSQSREMVFVVVGYSVSGTTFTATQIKMLLERELRPHGVRVSVIKARELLDRYCHASGGKKPVGTGIEVVKAYQGLGDSLRSNSGEHGAVAAYAVQRIREIRLENQGALNVYVIDSAKHPAE